MPGGHREGAHVVEQAGLARRHEVGQAELALALGLHALLAQHREAHQLRGAAGVGVEDEVVAVGVGRPQAVDAVRGDRSGGDQLVEHGGRVLEQVPRCRAVAGVVEDVGEPAPDLPGVEEERPVDVAGDLRQRHVPQLSPPGERGDGQVGGVPVDREPPGAGGLVGVQRALAAVGVQLAQALLLLAHLVGEPLALALVEQARHHAHRARGVEHVGHRAGRRRARSSRRCAACWWWLLR